MWVEPEIILGQGYGFPLVFCCFADSGFLKVTFINEFPRLLLCLEQLFQRVCTTTQVRGSLDGITMYLKRFVWYFEEGCVVLWRGWCGTLKRVVWYFEEGGVVLWRMWCGTLKRVVWYFEEGVVVIWRGLCGPLKRVVWYNFNAFVQPHKFGEVMIALPCIWWGLCCTLKWVVYFEEGGVVLWRGCVVL